MLADRIRTIKPTNAVNGVQLTAARGAVASDAVTLDLDAQPKRSRAREPVLVRHGPLAERSGRPSPRESHRNWRFCLLISLVALAGGGLIFAFVGFGHT